MIPGNVVKRHKRTTAPENDTSHIILEYFRNNPSSSLRNIALNLIIQKDKNGRSREANGVLFMGSRLLSGEQKLRRKYTIYR